MLSATEMPHIHIDEAGRAWIDASNIKVIEVVLDHLAYGWTPEEMHLQHPTLSVAQLYAALTYYHEHRAELDAEIEAARARTAGLQAMADPTTPLRSELEARPGRG